MQRSLEPVVWHISQSRVDFREAEAFMIKRAALISRNEARELIWLLEHDSIYTAGMSAKPEDLIGVPRFHVFKTGRGGQYTYHGPGQRVVYVMLDLNTRCGKDVRRFISRLQRWIMGALAELGVFGVVRNDRVGVWVERFFRDGVREDKIAALGIRLYRWVSLHGFALNVSVDLSHYNGIVPCGIVDHGVTSLEDLAIDVDMTDVDRAILGAFCEEFGVDVLKPDEDDPVHDFV